MNSPEHLFPKHQIQSSNRQSLIVRLFIYSGIFVNLLLPFYNYRTHSFGWWEDFLDSDAYTEAKKSIETLNSDQSYYYLDQGKFSDSIQGLLLGTKTETQYYSYRVLASMVPTQTLNEAREATPKTESVVMVAQAKYPRLKSYIGIVSTLKEQDTQKTMPISAVCEIEGHMPLPSTTPILTQGEIQCPAGSQKLTVPTP